MDLDTTGRAHRTRREHPSMTPPRRHRPPLGAMYAAALTVVATIAPYVDRATGHVLADHIRALAHPAYSQERIDSAVTTYLVILTVVGVLGVVSWVWTTWAAKAWASDGPAGRPPRCSRSALLSR